MTIQFHRDFFLLFFSILLKAKFTNQNKVVVFRSFQQITDGYRPEIPPPSIDNATALNVLVRVYVVTLTSINTVNMEFTADFILQVYIHMTLKMCIVMFVLSTAWPINKCLNIYFETGNVRDSQLLICIIFIDKAYISIQIAKVTKRPYKVVVYFGL